MEHTKILKRAWQMLWQYKALWLFGFLLALTTASAGGQSGYSMSGDEMDRGYNRSFRLEPGQDLGDVFRDAFDQAGAEITREFNREVPPQSRQLVINVLVTIAVLIGIWVIVSRFLRYISETALIQMVEDVEETGQTHTVREGFRLGWSRRAWRLFLIDLTINLPLAAVFIALFSLAISPVISNIGSGEVLGALSIATSVGLFFLMIFLAIVAAAVVGLLKHFIRRASVIDNLGVFAAIRQGSADVRHNLKDVGLMWLIMAGVNIGWSVIMFPLGLVLFLLALVLGGGVVLTLGGLTGAFAGEVGGIIITSLSGFTVFLVMLVLPLTAASGLVKTYESSAWTLTFRELRALKSLENGDAAKLEAAAAE